jgi:hypothetical protein
MMFVTSVHVGQYAFLWMAVKPASSSKDKMAIFKSAKALACSGLGMMLIAIATLNPSLSAFLSLLLVPLFLQVKPWNVFSFLLLAVVSPLGMSLIAGSLFDSFEQVYQLASESVNAWILYSAVLYPTFACVYLPWIILASILMTL